MLREPRAKWPARIHEPARTPPALGGAAAAITFIGHATFLIQTQAGNVLTDPMFSQRAGPFGVFGPRRVRPPAIRFDDLQAISTVLLSHNHYDHCDVPSLRRLAARFDPIVVTPLGNGSLVRSAGIRRVEELDWWQAATTINLPITLTPARHFSARTPFDRNRALWGGFLIVVNNFRIFFAGDSGYADIFHDIRRRLGPIDLALLPIGAYEPRWFMQAVHMNPAEAVQAHFDLDASMSVGMHFGTFQLTTEGIDAPLHALDAARRAKNLAPTEFKTLAFGESLFGVSKRVDFSPNAMVYDRRHGATISENDLDRLWRTAGLRESAAVLDIGAGTGRVAIPLAGRGCKVLAVEPARGMLAQLRQKAGNTTVAAVVAEGSHLPLPAGRFDAVVIARLLYLTPDWRAILGEVHRVLAAGGCVLHEWGNGDADEEWVQIREEARRLFAEAGIPVPFHPGVRSETEIDTELESLHLLREGQVEFGPGQTIALQEFLRRLEEGELSYIWDVPESVRTESLPRLRRWSEERFDLERLVPMPREVRWTIYRKENGPL
jgi:L-ascorbate metabolism protein UlaG (beta-lactamase superfamily)/SAM-dependent methyltransferase